MGLRASWVSRADRVLGERTRSDAVDLVADREPGDGAADVGDDAGDVAAGHRVLRASHPGDESHGVGLSCHQVLGATVQPGRAYVDEDVVVADRGNGDPPELEDAGGAVAVVEDRAHRRV